MRRLSPEIVTLYAELVDRITVVEAGRSIGHARGSFVTKTIKGNVYHYFQHTVPGGKLRQVYLGRKTPSLEDMVARFARERIDVDAERASVMRLCALLRTGGAGVTDAVTSRVICALSDAGVFRLGGVLVGTHAFVVTTNMLGVHPEHSSLRTDDVDIAGERTLAVAVPEIDGDIPGALESLEMGFLPVPGLSPKEPATSFKVRGRFLRVDLLTPAWGAERGAVLIPRFKAAAQPLRFLDYVLDETQSAALIDGGGVLVQVPQPARFALHKLLVAQSRVAAFQAKAGKDLRQAAQLIEILALDRPGDLSLAWDALVQRGRSWRSAARAGLKLLESRDANAVRQLVASAPSVREVMR